MKIVIIVLIILVVLGIMSFVNEGVTYTTQKTVDIDGIHAARKEIHHIPFGQVLGGLMFVSGIVLLVIGITGVREAMR